MKSSKYDKYFCYMIKHHDIVFEVHFIFSLIIIISKQKQGERIQTFFWLYVFFFLTIIFTASFNAAIYFSWMFLCTILRNRRVFLRALWILFWTNGAFEDSYVNFNAQLRIIKMVKCIFLYKFYANNLKSFELHHYNMVEGSNLRGKNLWKYLKTVCDFNPFMTEAVII